LYEFGFGLSYTTFEYSNLVFSAKSIEKFGKTTVTCEIKNSGKMAGAEVVQLYISDKISSVVRPVKELKGFQRITLKPGEKRRIVFTLNSEHLGFWNGQGRFVVEPGEFSVMVGPNSEDVIEQKFAVTGH